MITVVCGTNRKNSNSAIITNVYADLIGNLGEDVQVLYLEDLPSTFVYDEMNGNGSAEFSRMVDKFIDKADRFIFVIAEYNGSFPGVLKSLIDTIAPKYFYHKKAALVGVASGHAGALRALDQFTHVLHHIKVEVFSDKPKLSTIEALLDDNELNDADALKRINLQIEKYLKF